MIPGMKKGPPDLRWVWLLLVIAEPFSRALACVLGRHRAAQTIAAPRRRGALPTLARSSGSRPPQMPYCS